MRVGRDNRLTLAAFHLVAMCHPMPHQEFLVSWSRPAPLAMARRCEEGLWKLCIRGKNDGIREQIGRNRPGSVRRQRDFFLATCAKALWGGQANDARMVFMRTVQRAAQEERHAGWRSATRHWQCSRGCRGHRIHTRGDEADERAMSGPCD